MSTFTTFAAVAEEATGHHLPMPAWAFGVLALVVFAALLLFVWMFRHTARAMIEGGPSTQTRHSSGPHQGHGDTRHGHGAPRHGSHSADGRNH